MTTSGLQEPERSRDKFWLKMKKIQSNAFYLGKSRSKIIFRCFSFEIGTEHSFLRLSTNILINSKFMILYYYIILYYYRKLTMHVEIRVNFMNLNLSHC